MIAHLLDSRKGSIFILEITEVSREMDAHTISQLSCHGKVMKLLWGTQEGEVLSILGDCKKE